PWWDDMIAAYNSGQDPYYYILYKVTGTTPNRIMTIEWPELRHYVSGNSHNQGLTPHKMQVLFFEKDSSIEFHYQVPSTISDHHDTATVGLSDEDDGEASVRTLGCTPSCTEEDFSQVLSTPTYPLTYACIRHTPAPIRYQVSESENTYTEITDGDSVPFSSIELSNGGDWANVSFPSPYAFPFFGRVYDSVWITSNG